MALTRSVPHRCELAHPHLEAAFLAHFLYHVFRRRQVHLGPASGQCPAASVGYFTHHEQAVLRVKRGAAYADFRGRVAGLTSEQIIDPFSGRRRVGRHDL